MSKLLKYATLTIFLVGVVIVALGWYREYRLKIVLGRLENTLELRGLNLRQDGLSWVGIRTLRWDELSVWREDTALFMVKGLELKVNPMEEGIFRKIQQATWMDLNVHAGGASFDIRGSLKPAKMNGTLYFKQVSKVPWLERVDMMVAMKGDPVAGFEILADLKPFSVQHQLWGRQAAGFPSFQGSALIEIHRSQIELKSSRVRIGGLDLKGSLSYDFLDHEINVKGNVPMSPFSAFNQVVPQTESTRSRRGILNDVRGYLAMDFGAKIPLRNYKNVRISGSLKDSAWEKNSNVLESLVSIENEKVKPFNIQQLNPAIRRAILLSEDANFYAHEGFDLEIIQASLIDNLVEGRFVRGGGTISMQYVRNAFGLGHEKNLLRKAEEVLYTLFLEYGSGMTKDEILAQYLSVIEWGPEIYGIEEACRYYFATTPHKLNLDQGLFLASVIPNPKMYATMLEPDGHLSPFAAAYFESMRWMLYEEGLISEAEMDREEFRIHLAQSAI